MKSRLMKLALLATSSVSVAASYAGLSVSLDTDSIWWLLLSGMVAGASGIAIYAFWDGAFKAVTKPEQFRFRSAGWTATFAGAFFLLGMSSWWNVAGLGGNVAKKAALYSTVTRAERSFVHARQNGGGYQVFIPRLEALDQEIDGLAQCEGSVGCITGSPGKQGVYQTLIQLRDKIRAIIASLKSADEALKSRTKEGENCLSEMREKLNANRDIKKTTNEVSDSIDCINGVIGDIDGNDQLGQISQDMINFTSGLVLPLSIRSDKQKQAVAKILDALKERGEQIAKDAMSAIKPSDTEPVSLPRMSAMKAVVVYYDSVLPSWITGIGLDLLPLILLWFQSTLVASRRSAPNPKAYDLSVGELIEALRVLKDLNDAVDSGNNGGKSNP